MPYITKCPECGGTNIYAQFSIVASKKVLSETEMAEIDDMDAHLDAYSCEDCDADIDGGGVSANWILEEFDTH